MFFSSLKDTLIRSELFTFIRNSGGGINFYFQNWIRKPKKKGEKFPFISPPKLIHGMIKERKPQNV